MNIKKDIAKLEAGSNIDLNAEDKMSTKDFLGVKDSFIKEKEAFK